MSLQLRLIGTITALLLLALVVSALQLSWHARAIVGLEVRTAFDGARQSVRDTLQSDVEHTVTLRQVVASFQGQRHVRAALVNEAGKVIVQSQLGHVDHPAPRWFRDAMAPPPMTARIPIALPKFPCVVVLTSDPGNEVAEVWVHVRDAFTIVALLCLTIWAAMALAIGMAVRFFRRFQQGLIAIAGGDYEARLPQRGPPEFQDLAQGFNRMAGELAALSRSNRQLYAQLQTVQEEERSLIARDLHDEVGAYLFALQVDAKAVSAMGTPQAARLGAAIRESVAHIQDHVKAILRQLRPVSHLEFGLEDALRDLIAFWARRRPDILFAPTIALPPGLTHQQQDTAYRIMQEALSNAMRHGKPRRIWLELRQDGADLLVTVADDGGGIAAGAAQGAGLSGMRQRVEALGGRLSIIPQEDGVRICGTLPLAQERLFA
jgi:two-component system sensor histidine kinase UhpB